MRYENAHLKFASLILQFIVEAFSNFLAFFVLQNSAKTSQRNNNR